MSPHEHPPLGHVLAGVGIGVLVAGQSRVNGDLGIAVQDGVTAAVLSFISGWIVVLALVFLRPVGRAGWTRLVTAVRERRTRAWEMTGGLFGALLVAQQGGIVPIIGVALFSVALVGGATAGSIVVDRAGISPAGRREVTPRRVVSAVLATIGVAIAAVGDSASGSVATVTLLLLVGIVAITGGFSALQGALNGRLREASGDTFTATLINFTVGLVALLAVWAVMHLPDRLAGLRMPPAPWDQPLTWTGGLIGVIFVAVSSWLVRTLGVLLLGLSNVVGQVVGALALDLFVPVGDARVTVGLLLGSLVTVGAVVIGAARPRRVLA